jgi:RHS repeat-associated protein
MENSTETNKKTSEHSNTNSIDALTKENATESNGINIPKIELPKGGGALKGIDEKFQVNSANGTASFSIPLPISPGRNGFSPNLSLSYNSGGGNSPFGLGWNVDIPRIQRKTDKGIPQYKSGNDEDTFQFSGAEDLIPLLDHEGDTWTPRIIDNAGFVIRQYRPRVEGGFAKIERIKRKADNQTYWKVTTRDNTSLYFGLNANSRIIDPEDASRIFAWLPDFSHDDKGNWIQYSYKDEDLVNVPNTLNERNRTNGIANFTNRYLKRIKYGNQNPWYSDNPFNPTVPENTAEYFFELVLDYGEHKDSSDSDQIPTYDEVRSWSTRPDAFSSYRSGFEIRNYRRCHNIMMFHHFPDEEQFIGTLDQESFGRNYLVKSIALEYEPSDINGSGLTEVSYLKTITQNGFIRRDNHYYKKSLPPLEFEYQRLHWNTEVRVVDGVSIINAPVGLTNGYQWVDLYGEGINGILTEQGEAWYYKSNLGDVDEDKQVQFTKAKKVAPKPSFTGLSSGVLSLQDLDANGQKQIVVHGSGIQGYFEMTSGTDFDSFKSFETIANINLQDPNIRLLDLNGDGKPEIVMTEENVFSWFPSKGKKGHAKAQSTSKPYDDEMGPAIVFADQTQSIFLADMCGDGLTDIVRIRNGEICYWANKGYGNFSAKVNMDNAPVFDFSDQFNPKYLQLADISGTGATDIIYLGKSIFKAYINLTGNTWSDAHEIEPFFPIDSNSQISIIDLLGTGTSCIVWSSDLPAESHAPMRYMDLMDSKKPHVLKKHVNNLGKETTVEYKSSTWYYLKDKSEGNPWITKLPFPVQVISKTIVEDKITNVRFTAEYKYHHGYYDHPEREFRGFGMVEQLDTEAYEKWNANNAGNQLEKSEVLCQAPTLTKTWFHTGAFLDNNKILTQFEKEYWHEGYNKAFPETPVEIIEPKLKDALITINQTLEEFDIGELSAEEYREAFRACKGMMLRQEVFSLDAPIENPSTEELQKQLKPYTVVTHNCQIQWLQPKSINKYASFIVTESEAITISYERDEKDPRMAHSLNIQIDELGNILEAASVVYPRMQVNTELPESIQQKQAKTHIIYSRNTFTNDIVEDNVYRLRQPSETETFEITELSKTGDLFQLQDFENLLNNPDDFLAYHVSPTTGRTQYRPIEHVKTRYYNEELDGVLPIHQLGTHGMPYESYQLAYTPELLTELFGAKTSNPNVLLDEGKFVHSEGNNNWWIRSGKALFLDAGETISDVRNRFYSPLGFLSPFDTETKVFYYKEYYLFLEATEDALENRTETERFNFRTLSPIRMRDINDNISEVLLDELGLPKAMALLGKGEEADTLANLSEFTSQEESRAIDEYFTYSKTESLRMAARNLLQGATTRFVYNYNRYRTSVQLLEEQLEANPDTELCAIIKLLPTVTGSIVREQHHLLNPESPLQLSFQFSDGMGNVAMVKTQAEPGEALNLIIQPNCDYTLEIVDTEDELRWLGNGRTVLNNKGNPVKQYEPYFSVNPFYEDNKQLVEGGVTPIIYYDAIGRNIKTELPDGTFTKVEFDSWQQTSYDQNDTVMESQWYLDRGSPAPEGRAPADTQERAAWQSAIHYNTPSVVHLDTLGRPVLSVAHNRIEERDNSGNLLSVSDEFYNTIINLDIEGNAKSIKDARGNTVMEYGYDMLGHRVYQKSMDAGERWMLNNAIGNPIYSWDSKQQIFSTQYDELQRPIEMFLQIENGDTFLIEKIRYGDGEVDDKINNLRGQVVEHYDSSGRMANIAFDFKGNLLEAQRNLATIIDEPIIDWTEGSQTNHVDEEETFTINTQYDALGRMTRLYNWHRSTDRIAVYVPSYNERGVLVAEDHITGASVDDSGFSGGDEVTAIFNISYNEKGQRMRLRYGNGTSTRYHYDPNTFRLIQLRTTRNPVDDTLPSAPTNLSDRNVLQNLYYTYDAVGNITEIEDDAILPVFFNNQRILPKNKYGYDALYRLTSAEGRENSTFNTAPGPVEPVPRETSFSITDQTLRNYTQLYQYDAVGNIMKMRHIADTLRWTRNYEYAPDSNRLLQTTSGTQTVNYSYDAHGNMRNYNNAPAEYEPHWDYRDRVSLIDLGGGGRAFYQYDTNLERSRKRIEKTDGTTEERIYLGGAELYRRWLNGTKVEEIETHHLFLDDQRVLIVEDVIQTNNTLLEEGIILYRYQYSNHLGSVGLELDKDAAIISYEEYHPYGTVAYHATNTAINAIAKRYRYTGMERDAESGLNYHSARYYLPWLCRWLSADPIGLAGGMNLWVYGLNNPIKYKDLTGSQSCSEDCDVLIDESPSYEDPESPDYEPPELINIESPALISDSLQPRIDYLIRNIREFGGLTETESTRDIIEENSRELEFLESIVAVGLGLAYHYLQGTTVEDNSASHERKVIEVIRIALDYATGTHPSDTPRFIILEEARGALTALRQMNATNSQNIILRDATRYLSGRVAQFSRLIGLSSFTEPPPRWVYSISGLANTTYQALKLATGDLINTSEFPASPLGGMQWAESGAYDAIAEDYDSLTAQRRTGTLSPPSRLRTQDELEVGPPENNLLRRIYLDQQQRYYQP